MAARLRGALNRVNALSEKLSVSEDVVAEAASICTRGLERGLADRRPLAQISASSVYAACREKEVPRAIDDVASASGVRKVELGRCYRQLVTELDLKVPVESAAEFVASVGSRTHATAEVQVRALDILSRAEKVGVAAGKCPKGLAASALYVASALEGQRLTQQEAADAAGVIEATVRSECKRLRKLL